MKSLIIAAGDGTRMRPFTKKYPKPLMRLLGLSLIERAIFSAREAGIENFVVVVGYKGEKIKKLLGDGKRLKVEISYLKNNDWQKENAVSVLKGEEKIKEKFLLLMADHLFDPKVLERFLKVNLGKALGVLCVDKNYRDIPLSEATKVKIEKGKIVDISKDLSDFNAIDTGIFIFKPAFFQVLKRNIQAGKFSLSESVKSLAKEGKMKPWIPRKIFWQDIDDFSDFKLAEKKLLESLTRKRDGFISRHFNRKISRFFSRFLVKTPLSPNQISLLNNLIFGFISAVLFACGRNFLGGIFAQLNSIFDGCDGEMARFKFLKNKFGGWFDDILDRLIDGLIILGMAWGSKNWITGFLALIGIWFLNYLPAKYYFLNKKKIKFANFGFQRDVRLFLIMLFGIFDLVPFGLTLLALVSFFIFLYRLFICYRRSLL